ncbi:hypothetical protein pb186bvf_018643 [Paramecium bursaria]
MQMVEQNQSLAKTAYNILTQEGPLAFYKGIVPPLLLSFPVSAILFYCYEDYLRYSQSSYQGYEYKNWIIGGCYAGFFQSFVASPSELFKSIFQMQFEYMPKQHKSLISCASYYIRNEGIRSIFKGVNATIFRDIPQYASIKKFIFIVYFLTFESLKQYFRDTTGGQPNVFQQFIAGSLAGLMCITFSYPQDVIKTRIQCDSLLPPRERLYKSRFFDGGISDCAQKVYKQMGWRGFWQGFNSCLIYYMVAGATQLVGYEQCKRFLYQHVDH